MVIDSSALIAILFGEPEALIYSKAVVGSRSTPETTSPRFPRKYRSENHSHPFQVFLLADNDNDITGFQFFSRGRVEHHVFEKIVSDGAESNERRQHYQ